MYTIGSSTLKNTNLRFNSPEEGGVDFLELGRTSPKLVEEFAPDLL